MRSMEAYPRAAMERAMKVRRWRERYVEEGYNGLFDRRRGKPSRRRVPVATVEKVFALYREKYFDLNVQHFHEKLQAEHGIELSYTWVKQALQGAGLVARRKAHVAGENELAAYSADAAPDLGKTHDRGFRDAKHKS